MEKDDNGFWYCGPNFTTDKYDRQLALLICKAQLAFQFYFFKGIAEQYYDNLENRQLTGKHYQGHTALAYSRLPSIFTREDVDKNLENDCLYYSYSAVLLSYVHHLK